MRCHPPWVYVCIRSFRLGKCISAFCAMKFYACVCKSAMLAQYNPMLACVQQNLPYPDLPEIVKQLTIKDAMYWGAQAWEEATPLSLSKGWNKLLPFKPHCFVEEPREDFEQDEMFQELGLRVWKPRMANYR